MRTNIEIDDALLRQAMRASGAKTKRAAIDWRGTPLGYAERPAYARPGWAPGPSPAGVAPLQLPGADRPAEFRGLLAPTLPGGQTARPPRAEPTVDGHG